PERPDEPAQGAGSRRLAQPVPHVTLSLGGGLRPDGPGPAPGGGGGGAALHGGGPAPRAVAPGRDGHDYELYRAPVPHVPGRLRERLHGPERLGARSRAPVADIQSGPEGSARGHADRTAVRRGNDRTGRVGDGAGARRERGAAAGVLTSHT